MARLIQVDSILDVPAATWDGLCGSGQPFIRHGFLAALEASGSVGESHGWVPAHCLLENDDGEAIAAAPLYEKHHSYGEFVFDFAWANAYAQVGLDYYPKLLNAVPFTPVSGPRILGRNLEARRALAHAMARLPGEHRASSLHSLFVDADSARQFSEAGACARRGCQYRWYNRDYADFDAFLAQLTSKRRKEIRRERKRMHDAGVKVQVLRPDEIDAELWDTLYAFYGRTYAIRGQAPYLTREFFTELCNRMGERVRFFVAYHRDRPVGMAFMMLGDDTLYGRHWGCETDYHSLHFETCYYAGIEYCIENGLACFDAGAQGEHKIRRGFEPVPTWSYHVIAHPQLAAAIDDFCLREAAMMESFENEQRERSNFAGQAPPNT
ncbi:hypothetical protein C84B14_03546 [Salinisphaera sp. C84B14]|uniref:GNAT family N-acetyltransferase n=1 Tax=Salinisphaera sp. C84B14 TaxID=1304155 RepID=UPI00333FCC4A